MSHYKLLITLIVVILLPFTPVFSQSADREKLLQYEEAILKGEEYLQAKDYPKAKTEYQKALSIDPSAKYPKDKLALIRKFYIDPQDEILYKEAIAKGDSFLEKKNFKGAKEQYQSALLIKPDDKVLREKISGIDKSESDFLAKTAKFEGHITSADKLYNEKKYAEALVEYKNAKKVLPDENHPNIRIREIESLIATQKNIDEQYQTRITEADEAYMNRNYQQAISKYQQASALKPNENYPKSMIQRVNESRADAIVQNKQDSIQAIRLAEEQALRIKEEARLAAERKVEEDRLAAEKLAEEQRTIAEQKAEAERLEAARLAEEKVIAEQKRVEEERLAAERQAELDRQAALAAAKEAEQRIQDSITAVREAEIEKARLAEEARVAAERQAELDRQAALAAAKEAEQRIQDSITAVREAEIEKARLAEEASVAAERQAELDRQAALAAAKEAEQRIQDSITAVREAEIEKARLAEEARVAAEQQAELDRQIALAAAKEAEQRKQDSITATREAEIEKARVAEEARVAAERQAELDRQIALAAAKEAEQRKQDSIHSIEQAKIKAEQDRLLALAEEKRLKEEEQKRLADKDYYDAIDKGNTLYTQQDYPSAIIEYERASSLKPLESFPKERLIQINNILQERNKNNLESYNKFISAADLAYQSKIYDKAIDEFQKASTFRPQETYPLLMIEKIRKQMEDNAIITILEQPTIMTNSMEKRFQFNPIEMRLRKNNYIILKARKTTEHIPKVFINYGKDGQKSGGIVMKGIENEETTDYLLRISVQDMWYRVDNNWISIYPEGGDIEITSILISQGDVQVITP